MMCPADRNQPLRATGAVSPECRLVRPEDAGALGRLFERLRAEGVHTFFHPHPLTQEEAAKRSTYAGKDLYCVMQFGTDLVGYGLLRGWDEGYEVPALGIAIDPAHQGHGHGRRFMEFLHALALQHGATRVRIRVYPENARAVNFYKSLGYSFRDEAGRQLVGILDLSRTEQGGGT